jgi:hypothetical protein
MRGCYRSLPKDCNEVCLRIHRQTEFFAATGHLSPVNGAITQEVIDILAVLNALRAAFPPKVIHDL